MLTPTAAENTGSAVVVVAIITCAQRRKCGILATIGVTGITLSNAETDLHAMNVRRDVLKHFLVNKYFMIVNIHVLFNLMVCMQRKSIHDRSNFNLVL